MIHADQKPNWLLRGLIVISMLVHTALFMHIAGLYRPRSVSYIELTMRSVVKPQARDIPDPPAGKRPPPLLDDVPPQDITPQKLTRLQPLPHVPPAMNAAAGTPASPPAAPVVPDVKIAEWQPPAVPVVASSPPVSKPAVEKPKAELTQEQYRSIVQKRIVDRIGNNYPARAKKRNQQGRVVVSLAVGADGTIDSLQVVESSGHRILDRFVVREVKAAAPFARPPEGPVTVVIPIRFQLQ